MVKDKKTFTGRFFEHLEEQRFKDALEFMGPYGKSPFAKVPAPKPDDKPTSVKADPASPPLSKLIADFKRDQIRSNQWSAETEKTEGAKLALALDILGDKPISDITKQDAVSLKNLLLSLPRKAIHNGKPNSNFAGMSWQEIADQDHDTCMSPTTWNHYRAILSSCWNWAARHG